MTRSVWLLAFLAALSACRPARDDSQPVHGPRSGAAIRKSFIEERKRESARFTDADLQRMVDRLFVEPDPGRANFHGLLYAGARPVPYLIQALSEPRTRTTVFFREGFHFNGDSPFERICSLLDTTAPAEAVNPLIPYLDHPDPRFRREAAALLARIGAAGCLAPVRKALSDRDHEVRAFTLIGFQRGLAGSHRDDTFLRGAFAAVLPLLKDGRYETQGPANVLMAIDPERAAPILESPAFFNLRNPQLTQVLSALDREDVKVPYKVLLPLLGQLERLSQTEKPAEWSYGAALVLYARNPDDQAGRRLQILLDHPAGAVADAAARGLEIMAGIDAALADSVAFENRGFDAMTKPQQHYHAVTDYRDEVENGGHRQYFYNQSGDVYHTAIEGLREIGARTQEVILADAAAAFLPLTPAADNEARRRQMEHFGGPQDAIFSLADDRFFRADSTPGQRLTILLTRYALTHKSDFTPPPGASRQNELRDLNEELAGPAGGAKQ